MSLVLKLGADVLTREIAVDLGTTTTQVFLRGQGIVVEEPTVVAINRKSGDVVDIGRSALYLGTGSPEAFDLVWPMSAGAIGENELASRFLSRLLRPLSGKFMERMRLVLCVPSSTSSMEKRAVRDAARHAGATKTFLIDQAVAAALGGDLPVHEPIGTMIVVAGAGITEVALISLGSVVGSSSVRTGSAVIDLTIKQVLRREYGIVITDRTAEDIKLALSELSSRDENLMIEARGITAVDGSAATAIIEREEVQPAVDGYLQGAIEAVRQCLVLAPPELSQDLVSRGLFLAGGGALLGGLAEELAETFSLPVSVIPEPDRAAVLGAGKCLEAIESLSSLLS